MRRVLREPMVQMVLAGVLLFAVHRAVAPRAPGRRIEVSAEVLRGLRADHQRRTGLAPRGDEQQALVRRYVESEALYREALALALDRGDVIVRRRLVQKMELLSQGLGEPREPDDAALTAFIAAHRERYTAAARISFEHVFLDGKRAGDSGAITRALAAGGDPSRLGDPFVHGRVIEAESERELDARFGPGFGASALAAPDGQWSLPIRSSYGQHLLRVSQRTPARLPSLDELRARVRNDVLEAERARLSRDAIDRVVARYDIHLAEAIQ